MNRVVANYFDNAQIQAIQPLLLASVAGSTHEIERGIVCNAVKCAQDCLAVTWMVVTQGKH